MATRAQLDRWLIESQMVIERDVTVSSDAMRWRPDCVPVVVRRPGLDRPTWSVDEATAMWLAIGQAYRHLTDA
ncbi:MAG TPA: hypothetical protein VHT30_01245 [Acidimicrobiales bacterium]|jgi:hypothetical protein|nr:hypothetical protein [Acidimicrobiales bacterium]